MDRNTVFTEADQHHRRGELTQAARTYERLLADDPADPEVLRCYARCIGDLGQPALALTPALRAVAMEPQHAGGRVILGGLYGMLARTEEAGEQLRRALDLSPHMPAARWNYALWLLLHGRYAKGWQEYRWGIVNRERRVRHVQAEWDGYRRCDTLFAWAEQGLGDTLQFLRFLPDARRRSGAKRIILEVQEQLVGLLAGHPFADEVITQQLDGAMPGTWEEHVSLMSLPGCLGTTLETIPAEPYIWQEPKRGHIPGRVGICWAGNPAHPNDRNRSLSLEMIEPLLDVEGVLWTCLQKDANLPGAASFALNDFADTAEIVSELDLVITVDTAIAHLAGAMGKPVWILLPAVGDFRWLLGREDSPWYPSARLFRQEVPGEWGPVIERVKEALCAFAG